MDIEVKIAIAGLAITGLTAIGVFVGPRLANSWQEKQRGQKEALKNHFQDLLEHFIDPLHTYLEYLENSRGSLVRSTSEETKRKALKYLGSTPDIEQDSFDVSFKLHFPSQYDDLKKFGKAFEVHRKNFDTFIGNLEKLIIEKTGIPLRSGPRESHIHHDTIERLTSTLYNLATNTPPDHDFKNTEVRKSGDFWDLGRIGFAQTNYVTTVTKEESEKCKSILIETSEDAELQKRELELFNKACQLEKDSKLIAEELDAISRNYTKFGSELKKKEGCPTCEVIPSITFWNLFSRR